MQKAGRYYPKKWRPSLGMIVTCMLIFVLALPLGGVWLFRFYDSQLVRETESELIAQGAFVKAIVKHELEQRDFPPGTFQNLVLQSKDRILNHIEPELDLTTSPQLPRRDEAKPSIWPVQPVLLEIGGLLTTITQEAQRTTLAGFRVIDPNGTVIAGKSEIGQSLAHILEVRKALAGNYASVVRERTSKSPRPSIYSISRGTAIRVFVAMPIEYRGRVAGVVYLSRTPSHFLRELYDQRWKLAGAALFMLFITLLIAMIFVRTIKGPIEALNNRAKRIANGDRSAISPLSSHGTREIAELSDGLLTMSEKLHDRSDYIRTFANHVSHELKSPLTSIQGAAELIKDSGEEMAVEQRNQFLENIQADTSRLTDLLIRLRDLAATETPALAGKTTLPEAIDKLTGVPSQLSISAEHLPPHPVAISDDNLRIILSNLIENSAKHAADKVEISAMVDEDAVRILIADNGSGISTANRAKIFDMFFTTRRDSGGTGMGLSIVQSILKTHNGSLELLESETGAHFQISLRLAD